MLRVNCIIPAISLLTETTHHWQPDKHKFRLIDDAKRIKLYAANYCIETAREEGREVTDVSVRNVSAALGLNEAEFRICQALTERDLQELAQVPPHRAIGG